MARSWRPISLLVLLSAFIANVNAENVGRVVIVKIDGLPAYYVDRFVKQNDPETGRSILPWINEVFYRNGTRVPNFYTRGMSLSGPSWGQLDTGRHLQIKGNVEFDRYTLQAYDYLNFLPYYIRYGLKSKADMPAAEVMDQLKIPLLADAFPYEKRLTSQQLLQRGNSWEVFGRGFINLYPGTPGEMIDEWTIGLDLRRFTINQVERDIVEKLVKRPEIDYFDYYDVSFDHISHHNNDTASRLVALKELDRVIGRIWSAIQASSRAHETALVLISDHGFNSDEKVYSQGFNLVKMLASAAGGGHHVVTKRRLMLDYSLKGAYPFVPLIKTSSNESYYLDGESKDYSTALVDFDGNERSSIHLRDSDLNKLHILLKQLKRSDLSVVSKDALVRALFTVLDRRRDEWRQTRDEIFEEIAALDRHASSQRRLAAAQPKTFSAVEIALGRDKDVRRTAALAEIDSKTVAEYQKYLSTLNNLLALRREAFDPRKVHIPSVIATGAMGERNSIHKLQNYVIGPVAAHSTTLDSEIGRGDSFAKVNYFDLLMRQRVKNNVQSGVSSRPVDFIASRLPADRAAETVGEKVDDVVWLSGGSDRQLLILSRLDAERRRSYRLLPVAGLREDATGAIEFRQATWSAGLPLEYIEDQDLAIPSNGRATWLSDWHSEAEWFSAVHKTRYSNALIGLTEQMSRHPLFDDYDAMSQDEKLIRRFRQRQRRMTEADLLVLANDHWNFDVRGFNPGGNHGSFFRVSTNSTFMIAGGSSTGIPRNLAVTKPYDSLSFMPTILRLMGKMDERNNLNAELRAKGFREFPGPVINEITARRSGPH
ncbi:MAG: alkaline phosphatase family protein [Pyrinomonadaceae bacterium]